MVNRKVLGAYFKRIDFFARDIAFRENGGSNFGSVLGSCISLLIALIVALYGFKKFLVLNNYEDTNFNEFIEVNTLSEDEFG